MIYQGDCRTIMAEMSENSVDAIVTDPPYELGFMGKAWDKSGVSFNPDTWAACLRVLKPGGHLLAFGGTRTYHRIAVAIEDAGFEIRDSIAWIYGSGFPKSLDVAKAIDKAAGVEFESKPASGVGFMNPEGRGGYSPTKNKLDRKGKTTDNAKKWEGWGTALKPALEPICLARKPLSEKTVAANVLKWGTGALNIDGSRIGTSEKLSIGAGKIGKNTYGNFSHHNAGEQNPQGRWPANLIHDGSEEVERGFPDGGGKDPRIYKGGQRSGGFVGTGQDSGNGLPCGPLYDDSGSASRFFYCAKASRYERELYNKHPTVKPIALMEYLIKLVTLKKGRVLDPFAGSGSTLIAAKRLGRKYIGIELDPENIRTIKKRLKRAVHEPELF